MITLTTRMKRAALSGLLALCISVTSFEVFMLSNLMRRKKKS